MTSETTGLKTNAMRIRTRWTTGAALGPALLVLLLTWPTLIRAQFSYSCSNGTVTITNYTGYGGCDPDQANFKAQWYRVRKL